MSLRSGMQAGWAACPPPGTLLDPSQWPSQYTGHLPTVIIITLMPALALFPFIYATSGKHPTKTCFTRDLGHSHLQGDLSLGLWALTLLKVNQQVSA